MDLIFKNYINLTNDNNIELLRIRNLEYVKNNSKNKNMILLKDHKKWLETLKKSDRSIYFAVYAFRKIVGGINLIKIDKVNKSAFWGVFFQKDINIFIPSISAYCLIDKVFYSLDLNELHSEVNKKNLNAYHFNLNLGFKVYDEIKEDEEEYYVMKLNKQYWLENDNRLLKSIQKKIKNTKIKFEE